MARVNVVSGEITYGYYALPAFRSELNMPAISLRGSFLYAGSRQSIYRYTVSSSGNAFGERVLMNGLVSIPAFAGGTAIIFQRSHRVFALNLDNGHVTEAGNWERYPGRLPFSDGSSGLIGWIGSNGIDVFHNDTVTHISGVPCTPRYAATSESRWYFMCDGPTAPHPSFILFAVAP